MNEASTRWSQISARAKQQPRLLEDWKRREGPETTGQLRAAVDTTNMTIEQLAAAFDGVTQGVTPESAMRVSAVYSCVDRISGAISTLPMPIYERTGDGRQRVDHPYRWMFNEQPHPHLTASTFWRYILSAMLLRGDGFAIIERPSFMSSAVRAFRPVHPDRVQVYLNEQMELRYRVTEQDGKQVVYNAADVLQFPTLGFDGIRSPSPIQHAARNAVGIAMSAEDHTKGFFDNSARPDYFLQVKGKLLKEQREDLQQMLVRQHSGRGKSHLPGVLQGDWDLKQLAISNTDAQLIESRGFQLEEIARIYGVPPHMIGHTSKTTSWGTGIEQMSIGFVKYTLAPHLKTIEQEINRKIWPVRDRYFVEFAVDGLMRGDYKSRNEGYRIALGRAGEPGWLTVNEVRRLENHPPMPGGDELNKAADAALATTEPNPNESNPAEPADPESDEAA